jgi:glutamate/aspartate transport system permease protein
MDWHVVLVSAPLLWKGLVTSLELTIIAVVLSFPVGCLLAIGRLSHRTWLNRICTGFVHVMRSNPLVLILFWFYFLVPILIGHAVSALTSIVVSFVVFFSVYFAEIVRSGIQAIGARQIQAGLSSGLTYMQTMCHIVLPQALRAMLPALTTQIIVVFQGTTVAYVVGYDELLHTTSLIVDRTVRPVELYVAVAVIYFVICYAGSRVSHVFERLGAR